MARPSATSQPPNLRLPELIQGKWASAVILTYGADLSFFQRYLAPQLSQVPLRLILSDGRHLPELLRNAAEETGLLPQINRAYVVAPIRHPRAAHAKIILLTGPSTGRLLIGSGNLGPQGYTTPGELWHVYRYDETNTQHLAEFAAVRELIDSLGRRELLDPPVLEVLTQIWRLSPWIPANAPGQPQPTDLRHNQDVPLARAFLDRITALDQPVQTLTVYAPFYDSDAGALTHLLQQLKPRRVRVLLRRDTSVDPNALAKALEMATATELFHVTVSADAGTYLHAKWLHATTADHDVLLTGSANLSRPALLNTWELGNIEAGVLQVRPHGGFEDLYAPLDLTPIRDLDTLTLHFEPKPDHAAVSGPVLLWSRLDGRRLILAFNETFDAAELGLTSTAGDVISVEHTTWDGTQLVVTLTAVDAEQFADGRLAGLLVTGPREDAQPQLTLPYQLGRLRARLNTAASNRLLERTGNLPDTDRERLELLAQLEQSLILDQASAWRTSNPTAPDPDVEPGQAADTRWEDIDWTRLKASPRYASYGSGIFAGPPHTDVEVILASIYARLRPTQEHASGTHSGGVTEELEDDLASESPEVGADPAQAEQRENEPRDDGRDSDDDAAHRPLAVSTRTRMAFGRVVKRYRASLSNPQFVQELGPIATVTNAVIVHALLAQLLPEDGIDRWIAADAHLAIWQLLWGSQSNAGLVAELDPEERAAADDLITRGGLRAATWLALSNYAVDETTLQERRSDFRTIAQHLAQSPTFGRDWELCQSATPAALGSLDDVWSLAAWLSDIEVLAAALEPLGLPASAGQWDADTVKRATPGGRGTQEVRVDVLKVIKPLPDLTVDAALVALGRLALASWLIDDGRDYWRIRFEGNGRDVCFYDYNTGSGSCFIAGEGHDFDGLDLPWPPWWDRFEQLHKKLSGATAA